MFITYTHTLIRFNSSLENERGGALVHEGQQTILVSGVRISK